jgi:hypothetical protein
MHRTLVLAICYGLFKSRDFFFERHYARALVLTAESTSHLTMFFFHNKSANNTFSHDLSAKQTGLDQTVQGSSKACTQH